MRRKAGDDSFRYFSTGCYVSRDPLEASLAEIDRCVDCGPMLGIKLWVARRRLAQVPADRLVFGCYLPYFPIESALLKLVESPLPGAVREALRHETAAAPVADAPGPRDR